MVEMRKTALLKEKPKWEVRTTLDGVTYYWNNEEQDFTWEKPQELMTEREKVRAALVFQSIK